MKKIVIIGAGAMGSAFSVPCADNKHDVYLVGSFLEDDLVDEINKLDNFHPVLKCQLPKKLNVIKFSEFNDQIYKDIDLLVVGVSSKGIDWIGDEISKIYSEKTDILLLTKGLTIINNQFQTLAEKLKQSLNKHKINNPKISAVGGPCLANGLANRINSSVILANENLDIVKNIGKMISTEYYSTEYSDDLIGVEVCAATKNIYSMLIGAGQNLNTSSSLFQRSINEMKYLTRYFKGKESTTLGLAGVGDLYVSAAGGRNSKMGSYLGKGYTFKTAKKKFMPNETVEGEQLIREIAPFILRKMNKTRIPLMVNLIRAILKNKKLKVI